MSSASGKFVLLSARRALAVIFALPGMIGALSPNAFADTDLERKLPMHFTWYACEPNCGGWIGAVGTVTGDTVKSFDDFAGGRDLGEVTIVLDSAGGSVNDAIALGRKWRQIGLRTMVGSVTAMGGRLGVSPHAWCEPMCVYLLLSGKVRYVPEEAHVRVHQIWMGNRIENAKAATYNAQDVKIVQRDIGRLAKYTFDMGGTGELLSLSLDVPPWETLHELSPQELQTTNLINTDVATDVLPTAPSTDQTLAAALEMMKRLARTAKDSPTPKTTRPAVPTRRTASVSPDAEQGRRSMRGRTVTRDEGFLSDHPRIPN